MMDGISEMAGYAVANPPYRAESGGHKYMPTLPGWANCSAADEVMVF